MWEAAERRQASCGPGIRCCFWNVCLSSVSSKAMGAIFVILLDKRNKLEYCRTSCPCENNLKMADRINYKELGHGGSALTFRGLELVFQQSSQAVPKCLNPSLGGSLASSAPAGTWHTRSHRPTHIHVDKNFFNHKNLKEMKG